MPTSTQAIAPFIARRYAPLKQDAIPNRSSDPPTVKEIPLTKSQTSTSKSINTSDLVEVSTSRKNKWLIGFGIAAGAVLVCTAIALSVYFTIGQATTTTAMTQTTTTATTTTATTATTATTTTATTATTTSATTTTATTSTTTATTSTTSITTSTSTTTVTTTTTTSVTTTTVTTTTTTATPPNVLTNGGGETGSLSPWVSGGGGTAINDNGSAGAGISPRSGSRQFFGGTSAVNTLTQTINIFNGTQGYTAAQLDSGTLSAAVVFYQQSYYQSTGNDQGQVTLVFRAANGTTISTVSTPPVSCINSYCLQSYTYLLPVGTRLIVFSLVFLRQSGTNNDCYFDDASLRIV